MSNTLNRRRLLQTAAVGTVALATGQTSAVAAPASGSRLLRAAAQSATKISLLVWSNGPTIDEHFKERVQMFNDAHAGQIEADLQFLPYDQYWQKVLLSYSANDPYDAYLFDVQAYGHYKRDLLLNLQPYIDQTPLLDSANYPTHLFDPWRFDGTNLFVCPDNMQTMALFYNKDLLDAAGVPYPTAETTWDEIVAAAQTLTIRDGDRTTQWGMDIGDIGVWWGLQTLSWAQNTAFFDKILEPTTFKMSEPANIRSMTYIKDIIYNLKVAPEPAQTQQMSEDSGVFQSGRVALFPAGGWMVSSYQSLEFNWDMAPLPKFDGNRVVPYWLGGWVIPKASKAAEAAFEYARWSATDFQPKMAEHHDWIPILNSARDSEAMLTGLPAGFKSSLDAVSNAKLGDIYHGNNQQIVAEVFTPTFERLWANDLTPEEAAKEIDEKGGELLKG
jgi:multiple sugar transport system substrate-binding protein